ncbi:MAG: hypothetical protein RQ859_01770 [Pyrobaculum sp.]|nr:hypothetical protein [Pyrobaculum sp.]
MVAETKMVGALVALPVSLQDAPIMQLLQATRWYRQLVDITIPQRQAKKL